MSYVSRLRRGLPPSVASAVVTRRPGYLVATEPTRVDAELFRSLVARGHRELTTGRPELAVETLREALGLWRGDAYAEFDAPFAVTERTAPEELRLAALEDRAAAELDLGEGPALVAGLEALVRAYPLRERLWAQLMTALYRSGRQADALRSYQSARSALVEELGVEPGDDLQRVHALVLAHDPRLLGPDDRAARAGRDASAAPGLVGRTRELGLLDDAYGRGAGGSPERVLVTGVHGIGKTRLLAETARRVRAAGGSVVEVLPAGATDPGAGPTLCVLDGLERWSVEDLVRLAGSLAARVPPALVAAACAWDDLSAALAVDQAGRYAALLTVQWPEGSRAQVHLVDVARRRVLPHPVEFVADFFSPPPAFSGDGRLLVTADMDLAVVWDVATGEPAAGRTGYQADARIVSTAADATGDRVAVSVIGGGVEVVDTATGSRVTRLVPPGGDTLAVTPLVFSPDGRWLAGGSESGRVVVWDTATWDVRRTWSGVQGGGVDSLAFTPGSSAVVAGGAGTASVWDVDPRGAAGMTWATSALPSRSDVAVAAREEGGAVVTLTEDEGVQVWATAPQDLLDHACRVAGRDLTRAEWRDVLPSLPYARTCP